jgi:hypothetical protein
MTHSFRLFKELISRLSPKEISLLKKKFEVSIETSDKNKNKSKELLKWILKNPEVTKVEVERGLYGTANKLAFDKLLDRAIEKIDELLIVFTRDTTTIYSERNYSYFYLKRKLLVVQMRLLRGVEFDLGGQLEKIISAAIKFEHFDVQIDALYIKQRHEVLRNKKAVDKIQRLIDRYEEIRRKVNGARTIWTKIFVQVSRTAYSINYKRELFEGNKIIKADFEQTGSKIIGYYYYFLEMECKQLEGNYKEAEIAIKRLLSLVVNNESLYTETRYSEALINLANNKILLGDFSSAILIAIKSKNIFISHSINYFIASEVEFFARYYSGEFENAKELIKEVYHFCRLNGGPLLHSKYAYLFACINTVHGEIERSNELLLEVNQLERDKEVWNLGRRMLIIINGIEAKDYEAVELKVLSLEKFLKRISKSNYVRKRDKLILRILLKLINENYDFNKVYKQRRKYFDLLESSDSEYGWKIKSPELIIFHDWFKGKMKEKSQQGISI